MGSPCCLVRWIWRSRRARLDRQNHYGRQTVSLRTDAAALPLPLCYLPDWRQVGLRWLFRRLAALADEPESRAATLLAEFGLDPPAVLATLGVSDVVIAEANIPPLPVSSDCRAVVADAELQARALDRARAVGTEHLLAALLGTPGPLVELLAASGLALEALCDQVAASVTAEAGA